MIIQKHDKKRKKRINDYYSSYEHRNKLDQTQLIYSSFVSLCGFDLYACEINYKGSLPVE